MLPIYFIQGVYYTEHKEMLMLELWEDLLIKKKYSSMNEISVH